MGNHQSQHQNGELQLEEKPGQEAGLRKLLDKLASDDLFNPVAAKDRAGLAAQLSRRGATSEKEGTQGFGVVHLCCLVRWQEGLEEALKAGASVDMASNSGYTPLHIAAWRGSAECCRLLLEHGARLDIRSRRGSSATHFAAQQSRRDVLDLLLAQPANSESVDSPGFRSRTPLHLAVLSHGDPSVVKLLLDAGANASQANRALNGLTPLHTAAKLARVDAMRTLLEADANPNITSDDGVTPLLEVFAYPGLRHSENALRTMFTLLRDSGADVNVVLQRQGPVSLLHFALTTCTEESTLELLLNSGVNPAVNINRPLTLFDPRSKSTGLHKAAKRGWAVVAQRLVAAGADLTLRDRDGLQPIHVATINKRVAVLDVLLKAGADPHALGPNIYPSFAHWKMSRGMQAIQAMLDMQPEGFEGLAQLLEEPEEELSAVDMAVCVTQSIPVMELFRSFGVLPSEEALELAEQDTPIMRIIVERPLWTPKLHQQWPGPFKVAVRELLLCLHRTTALAGVDLPQHVVERIIDKAAYPVCCWANADWLTRQRIREPAPPHPHMPPNLGQPGQAGQAGAQPAGGAEGAAPGAGPPGAPAGFAGIMNQVFQQLQQGIADVLGQGHGPHAADDDDEEEEVEEQEGQVAGGGAAAEAGQQGGLLGALPPHPFLEGLPAPFMPQVLQQHALGPNMQVIQLEFNMPLAQLMEGPGAFLPPPGMPGIVFHAGPFPHGAPFPGFQGLFPGFMGMGGGDGEDDDAEEDSDQEEEQGVHAAPADQPHVPGSSPVPHMPAQQQQQQHGGGQPAAQPAPGAGSGAGPSSARQAPSSSIPPLTSDSSDDEETGEGVAGPSTHSSRKRPASSGQHYNLRPRSNKRAKTDH